MNDIRFVDTTIRDGQQSLWGFGMKTGMIAPVADLLDRVGFEAIEADAYAAIKMRVRQQHEGPWERVRLLARKITRTPLSMLAGPTMGSFSESAPLSFVRLRAERLAANGIRRVQIVGFMNDMDYKVPESVRYSQEAGMQVVIGLVFGESPLHTDDYYARKAREALKLRPDRLYLKDPIGLLTPERTRTIIPAIQAVTGAVPLEIHSHCTTGLAPLCYLEAIKLGVNIVHTGIPPLANGSAQPSVLNIARNARLLGSQAAIDEASVQAVGGHFRLLARREGFTLGAPLEYDCAQQIHHVPGGVISNLTRQLSELGIADRLAGILEETNRVRKDLGYPIMYTPFSQLVVTQATLNVITGERYREVPDEVIKYALGYWGKEMSSAVEPETASRILDRPRAKELAKAQEDEPSIREIRERFGGPGVSDDDLVMRFILGSRELPQAAPVREYPSARTPLVFLVQDLLRRKGLRGVQLRKNGIFVELK